MVCGSCAGATMAIVMRANKFIKPAPEKTQVQRIQSKSGYRSGFQDTLPLCTGALTIETVGHIGGP